MFSPASQSALWLTLVTETHAEGEVCHLQTTASNAIVHTFFFHLCIWWWAAEGLT